MKVRRVRRALRRLVRGTARVLPAARGQALVAGAQAAFTLLTGRQTRASRAMPGGRQKSKGAATSKDARSIGRTSNDPAAAAAELAARAFREELDRAELALREGRFAEAIQRSDRLVREQPRNLRVLQLRAAALAHAGDAKEHATALHRLHVLREDAEVRRDERVSAGELAVVSPGWLPRLPAQANPFRPRGEVILYLVDESAPYRTTPATARLQASLSAAVAVGLHPEVVTALGFPRSAGVTAFPRKEVVDGIPHHRLDLGSHYPLVGPPDARLADATWVAAAVARDVAPSVLLAMAGEDVLGLALVGAALREHLGVPLVVEIGPRIDQSANRNTPDACRRRAAAARSLQRADHVIVPDSAARDRLVEEGLESDRISIVAGGASEYGPIVRAAYDHALAAAAPAGARA